MTTIRTIFLILLDVATFILLVVGRVLKAMVFVIELMIMGLEWVVERL